MSSTTLFRVSGISLLIGSILGIMGAVIGSFGANAASTMTIAGALLGIVASAFGILGLPGMFAKQASRAGALGLIGTALLIFYVLILGTFGNALNALVLPFLFLNAPSLLKNEPGAIVLFYAIGSLLGLIGGLLLGIATIRAAILPRWAGGVLMFGVVVQFAGDVTQSPLSNLGFLFVMIGLIGLAIPLVFGQPSARGAIDLATHSAHA